MRWRREPRVTTGDHVCVFVALPRANRILPHSADHIRAWHRAGYKVIVVAAVGSLDDEIDCALLPEVEGLALRLNEGYDFGAWAAAILAIGGAVADLACLVTANDSVLGPSRAFTALLDRHASSGADVVGLVEGPDYRPHLQSFILFFNARALASPAFRLFWQSVRSGDRDYVIEHYEIRLMEFFRNSGLAVSALFAPAEGAIGNPTLIHWRTLLRAGFPFLKVQLLRDNPADVLLSDWRETAAAAGFDIAMLDRQIDALKANGSARWRVDDPDPLPSPDRRDKEGATMASAPVPIPNGAPGEADAILLFYDGFERKARERWGPWLYHRLRCFVRGVVRRARGKQVNTGFYEAFLSLVDGLRRLGCTVRINDFAAARRAPGHPVGLAGYPSVLVKADLPNPTIFGPGDPGYPDAAGRWARQPKVRAIIQPSQWFVDYYRPYCGDKMLRCPVGIDLQAIADARDHAKDVDVLVYDKIRWDRAALVPALRDRLLAALDARGLRYEICDYGHHTREAFFATLRRSRAMAFLCEHETQGLACEEALAMNVPVFAWEEGRLIDPRQQPYAARDLVVSSVPYFDARCGATFTLADLEARFDDFWAALPTFRPRDYVAETLSPEETARVYLEAYRAMIPAAQPKRA